MDNGIRVKFVNYIKKFFEIVIWVVFISYWDEWEIEIFGRMSDKDVEMYFLRVLGYGYESIFEYVMLIFVIEGCFCVCLY